MRVESQKYDSSGTRCQIGLRVRDRYGLTLRRVVQLSKLARRFDSASQIACAHRAADARKILEVLALGADVNAELVVTAVGPDAQAAIHAIATFLAQSGE